MTDKKPDIFTENEIDELKPKPVFDEQIFPEDDKDPTEDLSELLSDVESTEINTDSDLDMTVPEELNYNSRMEKAGHKPKEEKPKKKKKSDYTEDEWNAIQADRRKRSRNRWLIALGLIIVALGTGFFSYKYFNDKIGKTEANKEILYQKFDELFIDEEHTEIAEDVPQKEIDEVNSLMEGLPESTAKMQFTKWQDTLNTQFKNQENAKVKLKELYEGSNNYISSKATEATMTETEKAIGEKFNSEFQNDLLKEYQALFKQFGIMQEAVVATNSLFTKDNKLNEFTKADLENVKGKIDKNPNVILREKQVTKFNSALTQWEEREKTRQEEQAKLEQEQSEKEAQEQAKALEEARKQAEYEAQVEAERQAAYEKAQEEARKQAEIEAQKQAEINAQNQAKAEEEARIKAEEEARKKAEEDAKNQQEQTTPSSSN